jgi:hypothetical protein
LFCKQSIQYYSTVETQKRKNAKTQKRKNAHRVCQHLQSQLTRVEHAALDSVLLVLHQLLDINSPLHKPLNNLVKNNQYSKLLTLTQLQQPCNTLIALLTYRW